MEILRGHVICATRVATGNSLAGSLLRRRCWVEEGGWTGKVEVLREMYNAEGLCCMEGYRYLLTRLRLMSQ